MTDLSIKQLTAIIGLTVFLSSLGTGLTYDKDVTFYCESRDLVLECDRFSSTGKTCYYANTSKLCSEGWKGIEEYIPNDDKAELFKVNENNCEFKCHVEEGKVDSYTVCYCEARNSEAYLGELV